MRAPDSDNAEHTHRHAHHAWEDFAKLRRLIRAHGDARDLLHSISHHLRHVVYRSGLEVPSRKRHYVRRRT